MKLQDFATLIKYLTIIWWRGFYYEQNDKLKIEYDTIQKHRLNLTQIMIVWRSITLGAVVALPPFALYGEMTTPEDVNFYLPIWLLGFVLLVLWLILEIRLDKQIVELYPKIIKLEKQLGISHYTEYICRHMEKHKKLNGEIKCNWWISLSTRGRGFMVGAVVYYALVTTILYWIYVC